MTTQSSSSDSDDEEMESPNLHLDISPIILETTANSKFKIEIASEMYAIYPHPQQICEHCGESKIGEICVDGFVKTKRDIKVPVWGYINYIPEDSECHCDGELYENLEDDIEICVRNAWHYAPDDYDDKVELESGEFFMVLKTSLARCDANKLYSVLLGKEDINYYT